ncbi:unnamed protein product [Cunninghamella blakesleeana]
MPPFKFNLPLRKRQIGRTEDEIVSNKRQTRSSVKNNKDNVIQTTAFGNPTLLETKNTTKRNADTIKLKDTNKEVKKKKTIKESVLSQLINRKSSSTKSEKNESIPDENNKITQEEEEKEDEKEDEKEEVKEKSVDLQEVINNNELKEKEQSISKETSISTTITNETNKVEEKEIINANTSITTVKVNIDIKETKIEKIESSLSISSEKKAESNDNEKTFVNNDNKYSSPSPSLSPASESSLHFIDHKKNELLSKDILTPPPSLDTTPLSGTNFVEKPQEKLASPLTGTTNILSKLENERIATERATLDKLVKALDVSLTFHAARNLAAFFHKIQPMLRNSTRKNITLSHLCKILYIAPELYDVHAKLLKEFGKEIEAHQISFGKDWSIPLTGKAVEERKNLISDRSGKYFEEHNEPNTTIPEKELPKLEKIVDQKNWLEKAKLPDRVRSILELQEKRKAAKEESKTKPKVTHTGSPKERAQALLERIRNKKK